MLFYSPGFPSPVARFVSAVIRTDTGRGPDPQGAGMDDDMESIRSRARFALALSILAGIAFFGWFLAQGNAFRGVVAFVLFFGIGWWEYSRRIETEQRRRPPGMGGS